MAERRLRRRTTGRVSAVVLATVLTVLAFPASSAGAATSPIQPGNVPTAIPGATNGELPPSDLINVAPGCQAARAAGPSLGLLLAEARDRGVLLGTEQCYRSLQGEEQEQQIYTGLGNSACAAPVLTTPSGTPVGTSMHGWGKAADFFDAGGTVAFGSPGYRFLTAYAGQVGWNHPGWAQPGGSACPEAWHWEWVGDGGTYGAASIRADVVGLLPSGDSRGYATISGLGGLTARGDFAGHGAAVSIPLNWLMVGGAATPHSAGYWMVAADGGIFTFGNAPFAGSMGGHHLNAPIVGMAATPTGRGYWLVASDGGIFSFGDARFYGSMGGHHLNKPIVGMAATPTGRGYWLVASDGGIFSFGDARFYGSTGSQRLNQPVVGMAPATGGRGYWLVASDGGVFTFGGAAFHGSTGAAPPPLPVVSIAVTGDGGGYWVAAADGEVRGFGDAPNLGSA